MSQGNKIIPASTKLEQSERILSQNDKKGQFKQLETYYIAKESTFLSTRFLSIAQTDIFIIIIGESYMEYALFCQHT